MGGETFMRFQRAVSDFGRLRLLDNTLRDERLGEGEVESVGMYLLTQVSPFKEVVEERGMEEAQRTMRRVLEASPVLVLGGREAGKEGEEEGGAPMVYKKGSVYTAMTVVLQGVLKVTAGRDGFQCECGPYSTLAAEAIQVGRGGREGGVGNLSPPLFLIAHKRRSQLLLPAPYIHRYFPPPIPPSLLSV